MPGPDFRPGRLATQLGRAQNVDNLKAGVTKACWYDPDINPSYLDLARLYNTVILPTRTARPRDKAAAESGVQVVERWVLAPLRNHRLFSLGELNAALANKRDEVNPARLPRPADKPPRPLPRD